MIRIAIHGATGRMGRRLMALTAEDPQLTLAGAIDSPGHELIGRDAGALAGVEGNGVVVADDYDGKADVVIDFSVPAGCRRIVERCLETGTAMVIGTTGLTDADQAMIDRAAEKLAVVQAPNFNLGVNLLFALAAKAAQTLGDDYDIEILEAHHRFKVDAPSGTALGLAEAICEGAGKNPADTLVYERHGRDCKRVPGQITMQTLRIGDCIGEHTAYFAALGERLELKHVATNRDSFVRGALHAAKWLHGQEAGRYTMKEILDL